MDIMVGALPGVPSADARACSRAPALNDRERLSSE